MTQYFVYEGSHEWTTAHLQFKSREEAHKAAWRMNAVIAQFWDGECRVGTEDELHDMDNSSPIGNLEGFCDVPSYDTAKEAVEAFFQGNADRVKNAEYLSCPDEELPEMFRCDGEANP